MEAFYPLPEEKEKVSFQGHDNYFLMRLSIIAGPLKEG
jgi:hypothetical protein